MDGNYKAQHMAMPKSNNDVRLTDGEGYFTKSGPYEYHLKNTVDTKEVAIRSSEHTQSGADQCEL